MHDLIHFFLSLFIDNDERQNVFLQKRNVRGKVHLHKGNSRCYKMCVGGWLQFVLFS
jgi:hypothetical protein